MQLEGLIAATFSPFDKDGKVDIFRSRSRSKVNHLSPLAWKLLIEG